MSEIIETLVKAGLKINLSETTMAKLEELSPKEVEALAKICKKLSDPKSRKYLVYSEWSSVQPPGHTY